MNFRLPIRGQTNQKKIISERYTRQFCLLFVWIKRRDVCVRVCVLVCVWMWEGEGKSETLALDCARPIQLASRMVCLRCARYQEAESYRRCFFDCGFATPAAPMLWSVVAGGGRRFRCTHQCIGIPIAAARKNLLRKGQSKERKHNHSTIVNIGAKRLQRR